MQQEEVDPIQYQCKRCHNYFSITGMRSPIALRVCKDCPNFDNASPWRDFRVFSDIANNTLILINVRHIIDVKPGSIDTTVFINTIDGKTYECKGTVESIIKEDD